MMLLSQEYLKSILDYNPISGLFVWRSRVNDKRFNANFAGKVAGVLTKQGYIEIKISDKIYRSHRLAFLFITGEHPIDEIDHRDGNKSNNRFDNLRQANKIQNGQNRRKYKNNTSGYKGIRKNGTKWAATIKINKIDKFLGNFNCPTAAHFSYCKAAKKYHGEFARTE